MNFINNLKNLLFLESNFKSLVRFASKKTSGSCKNNRNKVRPKHRGIKINHGKFVHAGNILVTQRHLRFHPGLNVGLGKNGTLFAMRHGTVHVTCEKADLNWDHTWVQGNYNHRRGTKFYKKYFNVIPELEHQNFKLINQI